MNVMEKEIDKNNTVSGPASQEELLELLQVEHGKHLGKIFLKEWEIMMMRENVDDLELEHGRSLALLFENESQRLELKELNDTLTTHRNHLQELVNEATAEIKKREIEIITRLVTAAEFRDPETAFHIIRMSHYSRLIAGSLFSTDPKRVHLIFLAAPMHDIGKVGISDNILLKPGKLTAEEFELMKEHPQIGYEIMKESSSELIQMGAVITLTHHEKYNGKGYPQGLVGEDIPIEGRIVAVADVFDALTSKRVYKEAFPVDKAVRILKEDSGSHFDPRCVDAFLEKLDDALRIKEEYTEDGSGKDRFSKISVVDII
ncbi:MAG: HD domain-containing protein [bacterium]|nr:HD domain-containing protein [bacterium]